MIHTFVLEGFFSLSSTDCCILDLQKYQWQILWTSLWSAKISFFFLHWWNSLAKKEFPCTDNTITEEITKYIHNYTMNKNLEWMLTPWSWFESRQRNNSIIWTYVTIISNHATRKLNLQYTKTMLWFMMSDLTQYGVFAVK